MAEPSPLPPSAPAREPSARSIVIGDEDRLEPWLAAWDDLAAQAQRPYMAPAWTLAWWHHVAPARASLRVVVVARGDRLVGLTPLYVRPGRPALYWMLGLPFDAPKHPLALPGEEATVAAETAEALLAAHPPADGLRIPSLDVRGRWRAALRSSGPGAHVFDGPGRQVPLVPLLEDSYDAWFASKSRNFRQQMRRARRGLEAAGGRLELASTAEDATSRLEPLLALHEARWSWRGGSLVIRPGLVEMLREAVLGFGAPDRARLWYVEAEGRLVSGHLFFATGGRSSYWLGGFDDDWASYHPGMLCLLGEIEHAFTLGEELVDLGVGRQSYKQRLASAEEELAPSTFVYRGAGYARRRLLMAPRELGAVGSTRVPLAWRRRLRDLYARRSRRHGS